ncbi:hypothetical protein SLEP1_g13479 [Rubroshorea leprosula]|uniref:Receptor-like PK ALE2 N-terminal domain-containing protein n=1 Tax=Rubroshorea leprosula TaxID=152421 RepID=A0AAV5IKI1_9ROSI|nr:hypothetical protein SLEP1_g13479 [Rubroshorea leprosula]
MGLKFTLLLLKICLTVGALSIDRTSEIQKIPPNYPTKPGQPPWMQPDPVSSLTRTPTSFGRTKHEYLAAPPVEKASHISSSMHHLPTKVYRPHHFWKPSSIAVVPSASSSGATAKKWVHGPASSPSMSFHKYHHQAGKSFRNSTLEPSHAIHPPTYSQQGPSVSVSLSPHSMPSQVSPAPLLAPSPKRHFKFLRPAISPTYSSLKKMKTPPPFSVMVLPPPPPNADCASVTCTEPLTYTPPGAPCACVWPIQVKLHLGIAIYTFFPLVSELAQEIAASVQLNHSQVRIMGASSQELEKSTVLINLVPWEVKFNYTTALLIYKKFWNRQVYVKTSLFGPYKVVYVQYPGNIYHSPFLFLG